MFRMNMVRIQIIFQVSQTSQETNRPENGIFFSFQRRLVFFPFSRLILSQMRSVIDRAEHPFFAEKELSNVPKDNRSVKTP